MTEFLADDMDRSLGRLVDLQLGLSLAPDAVDYLLRLPPEPDVAIPPGTSLRELYDLLGHQMLLLGEPGAGKTTFLLDLARSLLDDAWGSPRERVPVVFRLPSWAIDQLPIEDWLGGGVGPPDRGEAGGGRRR